MKLATLTLLAGTALTFGQISVQASPTQSPISSTQFALEAPHYWGTDPSLPDKRFTLPTLPDEPGSQTLNDTADTVENLNILDPADPKVHLETDLNNDPGDPLLEDHNVAPVDNMPADDESGLYPTGQRGPIEDPLP